MVEHKSVHEAMVAIMAAVDPISKNQRNTGQGYSFRGVDDVYQALQAIMANHGVFTTSEVKGDPNYTEFQLGKNNTLTFRTRAVFRFTFWHVSGGSVSTETIGEGMDSGDKASNKSMSIAHKYALLQAFLIPTDEPKDPENDDHSIPAKVQPLKPVPQSAVETKLSRLKDFLNTNKERFTTEQAATIRRELAAAGTTDALLDALKAKADGFLAANDKATREAFESAGFEPEP